MCGCCTQVQALIWALENIDKDKYGDQIVIKVGDKLIYDFEIGTITRNDLPEDINMVDLFKPLYNSNSGESSERES